MPLITCKNLSVYYDKNAVLTDVSFTVNAGNYLCVIGENGSGKSTLIKALLSLKSVGGGQIKFGDGLRQSEIGYLPQQTAAQKDFPASVREVVLSGCQNSRGLRPFYGKTERGRARENMERMGIAGLRRHRYAALSGGQQRRVLLARALCATGRLLLLDEPTAGLDPLVTADFYRLIREISEGGITVIMISHDVERAAADASHILHLKNKTLFFGTAAGYIASETGKQFLGGSRDACYHPRHAEL